ncbi:hypothetical protein [Thiocystis violacea]|uniref:hypothetical protein n=1 Tax=Thiocystis violacea TaxID=13725 RepID=UPI001908AE04|nr:hypothetical protein [Thiocystis violacea]
MKRVRCVDCLLWDGLTGWCPSGERLVSGGNYWRRCPEFWVKASLVPAHANVVSDDPAPSRAWDGRQWVEIPTPASRVPTPKIRMH